MAAQRARSSMEQGRLAVEPNALFESIRLGDLSQVRTLLDRGEPGLLEQPNHFGFTPLLYAVAYNQKPIAEELLSRGANIAAQDKRGFSVLHQAAFKGLPELFAWLLAKGANPALLTLAEEKPYHVALEKAARLKYAEAMGVPYETRWGETLDESVEIHKRRKERHSTAVATREVTPAATTTTTAAPAAATTSSSSSSSSPQSSTSTSTSSSSSASPSSTPDPPPQDNGKPK
eukprot:RCo037765